MIAGDLDLERAVRDPTYLRSVLQQTGLHAPGREDANEAPPAADDAKPGQTPYPR